MGNCIHCNAPAGLLKTVHPECKANFTRAMTYIPDLIGSALKESRSADWYSQQTSTLAAQGRLSRHDTELAVLKGFRTLVDAALSDHVLSEEEEVRVLEIKNSLRGSLDEAATHETQIRLVKAAIIRDIQSGTVSNRLSIEGSLPVILPKGETLIWLFRDVKYYETKTKTEYAGRSSGTSFRVMKGVYFRVGASKGESVQTEFVHHADTGVLLLSDKTVHFKGPRKAFRIAMNKIISVEMFDNGIRLYKDGANPKPQAFELDDPWFAANAINFLA